MVGRWLICVAVTWLPLSACGASQPTGAQGQAIPWISTPAGPEPAPSSDQTITGLAPCRAGDLNVSGERRNAAGGTTYESFVLTNTGSAACSLQGVPAVQLHEADGSAVPMITSPINQTETPIDLITGGQAILMVGWPSTMCLVKPVASMSAVWPAAFGLLTAPLAIASSSAAGCSSDQLYIAPFAPAAPSPQATPQTDFRVVYAVPASATAGQALKYEVTLTNVSGRAITFAGCPGYTEALKSAHAVGRYVLNCRPVGTMAAGASVTFAMQLPVPTDSIAGEDVLSWVIDQPYVSENQAGPVSIVVKPA